MSTTHATHCEGPDKSAREMIYYKLNLLACMVDHMGDERHHSEYKGDDWHAMYGLLSDIAKEIYPEWKEPLAAEQGKAYYAAVSPQKHFL